MSCIGVATWGTITTQTFVFQWMLNSSCLFLAYYRNIRDSTCKESRAKLQFTVMAPIFEIFIPITLLDERNSDLQKFWSGRKWFSTYRNLKVTRITFFGKVRPCVFRLADSHLALNGSSQGCFEFSYTSCEKIKRSCWANQLVLVDYWLGELWVRTRLGWVRLR